MGETLRGSQPPREEPKPKTSTTTPPDSFFRGNIKILYGKRAATEIKTEGTLSPGARQEIDDIDDLIIQEQGNLVDNKIANLAKMRERDKRHGLEDNGFSLTYKSIFNGERASWLQIASESRIAANICQILVDIGRLTAQQTADGDIILWQTKTDDSSDVAHP